MKWTLVNPAGTNDPDTGDIYSGLDRFGRVKDNRWLDGAGSDVDRIQYGYDRAGNRTWRRNVVAASLGAKFDELYGYDAIHRLKNLGRGELVFSGSQPSALSSPQFAECWSLDTTGNWKGYKESTTGSAWTLEQSRTANPVNEITDITNSVGSAWVDPAYSRAGNMTTMPQPANPTQSYTATYDAWNRLVKIAAGANTVSEYAYDGAKRRIVQKSYTAGVLSETRHLYYTQPSQWQVIEERLGTSPDSAPAERQFVWGLQYIDDLVIRDRDTDATGTLDERLYACQDANWNVTAITDAGGSVQERYAYSAYGQPLFLTPAFGARAASSYGWESLYCGYRYETAPGLFYVRHRIFHHGLGLWVQRDPIGTTDHHSLYAYCDSQPPFKLDPYGLVTVGESCPTNKAACISDVAEELKKILQDNQCFNNPGKNDSCRPQLKDCLLQALDGIKIECRTRSGERASAVGMCIQGKTAARKPDANCQPVCDGETYIDPGCGPCPKWAMDQSAVNIGTDPPASLWGGDDIFPLWCTKPKNRKELRQVILHEMLHHCMGGHSGSDKPDKPDRCGRPGHSELFHEYVQRCG